MWYWVEVESGQQECMVWCKKINYRSENKLNGLKVDGSRLTEDEFVDIII